MDLMAILGKKYTKEILLVLGEYGSLHYRAIINLTKCPHGTLSDRLNELEKAGLIITSKKKGGPGLPFKFCKLTELGKKAIVVYKICDDLKKLEKNQKLICCWDKNQQLIYNIIPETDSN